MRKSFHILYLITFISLSSLYAQVNLKVGANFGGQISSLRGIDYETENGFELVPMVGLNLEVQVSQSLSFVTGFNFERWKKKRDIYNGSMYLDRSSIIKEGYDFYNMPFLIRYKLGSKNIFFVDGGGFVNYFNKGIPNSILPLFINFEDYNFGVSFGGGVILDLNDYLDFTLQIRDDLGLSDINKYKTMVSGNVKTNTIRLIATLNYKL